MGDAHQFLSGAVCMAYVVVGMYFLKFWKKTHDAFFLWFSAAFFLFACVRITLSAVSYESEVRWFLYLGRALAVLLIVGAIVHKNRRRRPDSSNELGTSN